MKKIRNIIITMGVIMFCSACNGNSEKVLAPYNDETPKMNVKEFFNGDIKAWGIVQNRGGEVIRRFEADLIGTWDGNKGKLAEIFTYNDGEKQEREWNLEVTGENTFNGTASDIVGTGKGLSKGNALRLQYVLTVPVGDTTYDLTFDDRMWLISEDTLMNRAVMKKFGFKVGELIVFMQKQPKPKVNSDAK